MRKAGRLQRDAVDALPELAGRTKNFSGAEIEGLVKSATSYAFARQVHVDNIKKVDAESLKVTRVDFERALDEVKPAFGVSTDDLSPNVAPDSDPALRKAYHRLAAKYHPDKNPRPEARELFERVQKSYEFLCAESRLHGGPDRYNISLMLRAQVILY